MAVSNLRGEIHPISIPLTTPLPKCLIVRAKLQQLLNISLGSRGKLLMHNWAMKSDMVWHYVSLG